MPHYETLTACVRAVTEHYREASAVRVVAYEIATMRPAGYTMAPAFVFRGESNVAWTATTSSMERLRQTSGLSQSEQQEVLSVVTAIQEHLQKWLKLSPPLAAGLLQHYGFPTEVIDVSPRIEVAAFFAAFENVSGTGSITVFPLAALANRSKVFDLTPLTFAARPTSQSGWAIFHDTVRDWRNVPADKRIDLERHTFAVTAEDIHRYVGCLDDVAGPYVDAHDLTRAIFTHLINALVRNDGPLSSKAARYFAEKVPPTPLTVTNIEFRGNEANVETAVGENAARPYSDRAQIEKNFRRWAGA